MIISNPAYKEVTVAVIGYTAAQETPPVTLEPICKGDKIQESGN